MGKTKIQWSEFVWNPISGCSAVSEGCRNCFAARMAATRLKHHPRYEGLATIANGRARWTGEVRLNYNVLEQPLRWRKPRRVFVCSMSDLFHKSVSDEWHWKIFKIMAAADRHIYQVLTKHPSRMLEFCQSKWYRDLHSIYGLPNVWLGVSIENQAAADERREYLRQCPAAVKFVSYEPALGPVDWTGWEFVSQIISGGESGPGARPSHAGWHRVTRDFCQENNIAYFFKQWGAWVCPTAGGYEGMPFPKYENSDAWDGQTGTIRIGKKRAGHLLDGRAWQEFPKCS